MSTKKFYSNSYIYLAVGVVIVFLGFSKSYFSNLNEFSFPYHLHGISATLWMILLVIQPYLFKKGQLKVHRILGWSSIVLVPIIILAGLVMINLMIHGQQSYPPNTVYKLAFIDVCTLIGFALVYSLAIYHRKNLKLHSRFMVSTIFGPLLPALTRLFFFIIPIASTFNQGLTYSYLLVELVLLVLIFKEYKVKEVRYTYIPFFVFIVIQHLLMYSSNEWKWWIELINTLTNYTQ